MSGLKEQVAEGIPCYFNDFKLYRGSAALLVKKGRVDSGDIIEAGK